MKEKLAKLIDVKSIMTLLLTAVFCLLAVLGKVSPDQFVTIFTVIVGFYFGTQAQKRQNAVNGYIGPQQYEVVKSTTEGTVIDASDDIGDVVSSTDTHPPDKVTVGKDKFGC